MKGKGVKKKRRFGLKRFIAVFLVLTFLCQMPTSSLVVSGFQALFNLVGNAKAAVDSPTIVRLTNAQNYPSLQQASGDVCVDDFVEFYSSDGYVGYNAYCLTDYRNGLGMYDIERRESEFKAYIAAMNTDFKNYEGDAGGGIEYEPYETVSAGKNVNYFTLSNGSSSSYGTLDESAVPAKLMVKQPNSNFDSTIYYNKRIDVTDRVNAGGMLKFSFSMRVLSTDRSYIDISFANEGKIISQGQTWSAGNYRTSGSVDSKNMTKASDGKYYIDVKLKKNIGSIDVSDLKFNVEGTRETKFVNMYMTNNPVPAGIVGSVTNATGEDPTKTTDFTADDDMYVVLQFTDAVRMRKKMYYDTNTKPGLAYNYAYKTYPRLALTVTDETGMEQNKKEALYADYFGVMDGYDANGNIVPNNSLIFKVDISGWKNKDFSIVCLSEQLSKIKRSGNMEWAYKSLGDVANQVAALKEHWGRGWKERPDNDRFRGAVLDANGKEIPITERALVRSVKVTNAKGETEEVIPTYHGSTPAIKEVVITAANGKEIVKKGDRVNIKVVFDAMLNEELPPPTFYLNDYSCYTKAKPGDEDWDGTVVTGGVYGDTRMVPLLASWTIKKNDPNNVWTRKENQDITDNHSGAATFEITGADEIKGNRIYYRVADDISVAMQKGDVFDPSGWSVYTKPVYLTNLPTVLKREVPINGTDKVELQRICNGGVIEVCEVTPTKVTDEDGNVTGEELIVHKFGTSDEIDTSADSEEAMVQENTSPGTVISYSVVLDGAMDVKKLFLIPDWESYEYEYYDYAFYDCDTTWRECWTYQYISRLRMDGEVENKWGKKLPEKNFGSYDSNGKFSYTSRQYSYVGTESKAPLVSIVSPSRAGYKGGSDLEKATGFRFYDYLDLPRWELQYYMETIPAEKGYYSRPQTGNEKYIVEVGPVKADIMVDVNGKEEEVQAGETYKRTMYVATAEKDDKSIYVATELLPDENGNYNRVDVPVTVKVIDMAGNMAVRDVTHTIGLPYAEFEPYAYYKDPVAMKYSSQQYQEEEGLYVFYPDIEDETDDFKAEWYKIAIVPQGEEPDENTQWVSLGDADVVDGEKNFEIEDEQGNKLKARLWKADTCPVLWVDIPVRGSTINKSVYITYETKYGNKYNYTSINEESQKVRKTYKMADFVYDTSDVPELIDLDKTTTYRVTTVDKSSDPMSGVSIELADGQMINGKLKRKNFYKFNVTTDQYTKVYYSFRTRWGGVEPVRGEIPPNSTITLDTRDLGVKYTSDSPFKGSAWLEDWTVDFIPVTIDTYTVTEYTEEYSEAGELVNTTSTVVDTYEKEGEIVNGRAKYYELPMLDEMFVRRSEEYHDFHNDDTSSMNNRIFLETELDYNSLNGYNDFHWYMSRKMAYTNTLFDNTTMVFGEDVSEYLEPETDIDFANSYIYIYPVKENEKSGVVDYVKSGECVRKIPLPSNIREVTYSAGYGTEYTALGFDVDLNAYVTEQTVEYEDSLENGTTVEKIGMPKEGTYGAFVEIATFLEDENGEPVVISSNHYEPNYDTGEKVVSQIEIPDVVFTYDYSAPEGGLYFTDEVLDYIKNIEDIDGCKETFDGSDRVVYNLTWEKENGETYYSDEKLMNELNSKESVAVRPGGEISLYVANPSMEIGGCDFYDGDTEYDYSYYAEGGNMYNYNENCEISYAFVPIESFDQFGNIHYEKLEEIEWQHDMDEYERAYNKVMNITVPEDMTESCYIVVKMKDSTGNESEIFKKRVIPDTTAPTAMFYQYNNGGTDYIQLIQVNDDYSKLSEIYVLDANGTAYEYGELAAEDFRAEVTGNEEYTVTLCDGAGNERIIFLSDSGLKLTAPTITNLTENQEVKETMVHSATEEDMLSARDELAASENVNELVYDTNEEGNGHLSFSVLPGMGEDIYVDYAWSSDSYKKLNGIESEDDYGYIWNKVESGSEVVKSGMVSAIVSEEADVSGAYEVNASVMLPKAETDEVYVLTFRFRNGAGLCGYYTVAYKVTAAADITFEAVESDEYSNRQTIVFSEPVKIVSPTYYSNTKEYATSANIYCDANGNYELVVKDLRGNEKTITYTYDGKPYFAPDINVTSDSDGMYVELDMGYTRGYAMTFDAVTGQSLEIMPAFEEGQIVTYGDKTAYLYAMAYVTGNTEFTVGLLAEDGVTTETYTYYVDSYIESDSLYSVTYSREATDTSEENAFLPVDAELSVPDGAEVLSTDGTTHTFYKNGSYTFEVKTPEGDIKKITATVDWITESESDSSDDVKPLYTVAKYIRNEGELMDITSENAEDVMTNATVQVRVFPFDVHPETGELNPVSMTISSENGNAVQSEEDEFLITFTDNDVVEVTLTDPSGNKTVFDVTVDNINKEIPVTGKIRYVRYGITEIRAYITLPDGIKLRDLDGIQTEERSDGSVEYYHLFTQNGMFTFKLAGENGSTADLDTKYVQVVREPLNMQITGYAPEEPAWGEGQVISVSSNLNIENMVLTDENGAIIEDMETQVTGKKILVKFDENRTVICRATAENGSVGEITLASDSIPEDSFAPNISYTIDGAATDNQRKVNITVTDIVESRFVKEDTNISIHVEGSHSEYVEGEPVFEESNGTTTITKNVSFIVREASTYKVYAYDMNSNKAEKEIDVLLDHVKPVLVNLTPEATETEGSTKLIFAIENEAGTIHCAGQSFAVDAGEQVTIYAGKNGKYTVSARDIAGNISQTEVEITHLDTTAPVITAEKDGKYTYSYRDFKTEEELLETILKRVSVSDDSGKDVSVNTEFTIDVNLNKSGRYVAIVTAKDPYGNVSTKNLQVTLQYNEVIEHKELETFGVNGEVLVENGVITTDSKTLNFVNIPEGATLTWAKGKNTGAQMKYRGTLLEGNTITVTEKDFYTVMVKLSDYTVHIYYVAIN